MTYLSQYTDSRDNNFNLVRFLAASLVIFSHSYPLVGELEPLKSLTGKSLGGLAVDIFFISSGFLICRSFVKRPSLMDFSISRVLRIYPALIVAVLFCTFLVGLNYTSFPIIEYLTSTETYSYLIKNSLLVTGIQHTLPGVFESLPFSGAVNGSLWTLPYEIAMYTAIVILLLVSTKVSTSVGIDRKWGILAATIVILLKYLTDTYMTGTSSHSTSLSLMFLSGSSYYMFRDKIYMSWIAFSVSFSLLVVAGLSSDLFNVLYPILIPYIVLFIAYIPKGRVLKFNHFGDYSYGIYIYAFPIQQIIVFHNKDISAFMLTALAFPATLALAYLSWHLIEEKSLKLKSRLIKAGAYKAC